MRNEWRWGFGYCEPSAANVTAFSYRSGRRFSQSASQKATITILSLLAPTHREVVIHRHHKLKDRRSGTISRWQHFERVSSNRVHHSSSGSNRLSQFHMTLFSEQCRRPPSICSHRLLKVYGHSPTILINPDMSRSMILTAHQR